MVRGINSDGLVDEVKVQLCSAYAARLTYEVEASDKADHRYLYHSEGPWVQLAERSHVTTFDEDG